MKGHFNKLEVPVVVVVLLHRRAVSSYKPNDAPLHHELDLYISWFIANNQTAASRAPVRLCSHVWLPSKEMLR